MTTKALTASQLRKLSWPKSLLQKQPLSVDDCYQIGEIVVHQVQQEGLVRLRARKAWSMRRLQTELGVASAATFTRCVQVYEMASELGLKRPLQGVSASTLFLVAGLPKAIRSKTARRAISEGWSKRRIEHELGGQLGERRGGRPPGLGCIKALSRCSERSLLPMPGEVANLEATKRKAAMKQVQRLLGDMSELRRSLGAAQGRAGKRVKAAPARKARGA
jgi:hypothetical protein